MPRLRRLGVFGILVGLALPRFGATQDTSRVLADRGPLGAQVQDPSVLDRVIGVKLEGVTLERAVREIARLGRIKLSYSADVVDLTAVVSLAAERITVGEAFAAVLQGKSTEVRALPSGQVMLVRRVSVRPAGRRDTTLGAVVGRVTAKDTTVRLAGAVVQVKGTSLSTTTGEQGVFAIYSVPPGRQTIVARLIGYRPLDRVITVPDSGIVEVSFALEQQPLRLQELVTTATGEQRRMDLGNAITTIRADSILQAAPIKDLTELLETRVPGMSVQHMSGAPGDPARIRLRGLSSIYRSNDPVVFVDGVRVYAAQADARSGNLTNAVATALDNAPGGLLPAPSPIDQIDPNSIEKVEVFKGPSAVTMYGADAANGVIVVTTKRGRAGPTRWDASIVYGRSKPAGDYPSAYYRWGHSVRLEDGPPMLCPVTNLGCVQDSVVHYQALNDPEITPFGTGHRGALSLTASGGNSALTYSITGSYSDETGLLQLPAFEVDRFRSLYGQEPPDWMRRPHQLMNWSGTSAVTAQLGRSADVTLTTVLSRSEQQRSSLEVQGLRLAGTYPDKVSGLYYTAAPGRLAGNGLATYLVSENAFFGHDRKGTASATDIKTQIRTSWRPLSWLDGFAAGGLNVTSRDDQSLVPAGLRFGTVQGDTAGRFERGTGRSVIGDVRLGVQARVPLFWGFQFQVGVGADVTSTTTEDLVSAAVGLVPGTNSLNRADSVFVTESRLSTSTYGWYVEPRLQHSRFTITSGLRFDGGSTYGGSAGLSAMPKFGASWLISEEPFFPFNSLVTLLRLRGAYGRAGVQPGPADRLRLFLRDRAPLSGQDQTVLTLGALGNTELRPERSTEFEGGFDAELLDSRFSVELTAYRKTQDDALMLVQLPPSVYGGPKVWKNIGVIRNTGMELAVGITPVRLPALTWSVRVQSSWNRNRVVRLAPGLDPFYVDGDMLRIVPGFPVGGRWARPITGYADANGDGVLQPSEVQVADSAVYMGSLIPERRSSFSTDIALFGGAVAVAADFSYESGAVQVDRGSPWVLARPLGDPAAPLGQQAAWMASNRTEYGLIHETSTFRFNSLSVRYRAPQRVARLFGAEGLSLAVQGRNLGLHSTYNGRDPSVSSWTPGEAVFDSGQLAQPRDWQLRFDLSY